MSSLKALAAAKNRRSGGEQHITSGTRPGTSIASHGAFAQQYQGKQPRGVPMPQQQQPQVNQNGLPFSKLSVSAINWSVLLLIISNNVIAIFFK